MKISQNRKHLFLLRSTFVINNFDKKIICKKRIFSYTFFKVVFPNKMQAEWRAVGPKNNQKKKNAICKLRWNIHRNLQWKKLTAARRHVLKFVESWKNQRQTRKNNISLCSFLFLTNSKGILYKALRLVNGCSVKKVLQDQGYLAHVESSVHDVLNAS